MSISSLTSSPRILPISEDKAPLLNSKPIYTWLSAAAAKTGQTLSQFFSRQEAEGDKKVRTISSSPPNRVSVKKITRLFVAVIALSASRASAFCAYGGAMCLAPAPICKDSLPRGISIHLTQQKLSTITKEQLHAAYEMGPDLGISDLGGVAMVTPTCHAHPGERFALKMSAKATDPMIGIQLVSYLLDEGITPHLVRTYEAQNFEYDSSASVSERMKNMQFLRMELLPGDLNNPLQFSVPQRLAFALQQASTLETLIGAFHVAPENLNLGDLFYHELTDRDCFRGQVMKEMDYWKYPMYGQVFYLPRMPYILKIGDYDSWKFLSSNKQPGRFETVYYSLDTIIDKLQLHSLMIGVSKETIRDLLQQWSILPPSQASLLDFGVTCLQNGYLGGRPPEPISI